MSARQASPSPGQVTAEMPADQAIWLRLLLLLPTAGLLCGLGAVLTSLTATIIAVRRRLPPADTQTTVEQ